MKLMVKCRVHVLLFGCTYVFDAIVVVLLSSWKHVVHTFMKFCQIQSIFCFKSKQVLDISEAHTSFRIVIFAALLLERMVNDFRRQKLAQPQRANFYNMATSLDQEACAHTHTMQTRPFDKS